MYKTVQDLLSSDQETRTNWREDTSQSSTHQQY